MRPIKLTMSAFGPYSSETTIDFTKFDNDDIFLITGTTGSGKTSIFDAISFALYGKPSGSVRDVSMLRNISASAATETFVHFTFEYQGIEYKIERSPRYMRNKRSGEGLTESIASATLSSNISEPISGVNVVDQAILDILKINQNQFSQIVMIAQNDFMKFLVSNTSERKVILRTIFSTEFYSYFESELKSLTTIKNEELKKLIIEYNSIVKNSDEEFNTQTYFDHTNLTTTLTNEVKLFKNVIKDNELEIKNLQAAIEKDNKLLILANKNNDVINKFKLYEAEYLKLKAKTSTIDKNRSTISQLKNIKENIQPLDLRYQESLKEIEKLEVKLNNQKLSKVQLENKLQENLKLFNEKANNLNKIKQFELKLNELKLHATSLEEITLLEANINKNENQFNSLNKYLVNELLTLRHTVEDLNDNYTKQSEILLSQNNEFNQLHHYFIELEQNYLANQAGLLASKLVKDTPCPVCGSLTHPKIASLSNADIEEEYLANKKRYEQSQNVLSTLRSELEVKKTELDRQNQTLNEYSIKAYNQSLSYNELSKLKSKYEKSSDLKIDDLDTVIASIKELSNSIVVDTSELNKLKATIPFNSVEDLAKEIKNIESNITKLEKHIQIVSETHQNILDEILKNDTETVSITSNLNELTESSKANLSSLELLINQSFPNREMYDQLLNELDKLSDYIRDTDQYDLAFSRQKALYEEYLVESKDLELIETDSLKLKVEANDNDLKRLMNQQTEAQSKLSKYTNILDKIVKLYATIMVVEEELKDYSSLSETAAGVLKDKEKLTFEAYAQMAYFDQILKFANLRLKVMSNNQYELVRRENITNKRSQSGLDLDIFDYYNGTRRDVASLSGGESFNASLALALGLSDVIQHVSGGVQIDALFIDEGFGTLSDEYLDNAINTLVDVAGSNRMIGVISHVKELKDAIVNQIQITKDKDGSKIEIVHK